ncbi:uncharacterized protein FTOL_04206 [Fusarium torulosum]|uniref:Uncharacterized protein n=1 Tax=Fusarium torulosum TaxID=33205 RepID=A0AAE8SFY1_9HYPO|nr:uncharacterized protein FTOL_04206 [Fusarium torulosum]
MEQETEALQRLQAALRVSDGHIDQEAQRGNKHTLDVTVQSHIPVLTFRYVHTTIPMALIEAEIHHLWYTIIKAAKHWDATNPKQDTLVRYLLSARARGTLTRPMVTVDADGPNANGGDRQDVITCSDGGKFWYDLPLLGQDLMEEWNQRFYTADYDGENNLRSNLAAFVGRLVSVGIWNGPAACALSLFRETLETPRSLVSAVDTKQSAKDTILPIKSLVFALQQMLCHSEGIIINLSNEGTDISDSSMSPDLSGLGELAVQSGLSSPGYNPDRWWFWIERLKALATCEVQDIADSAECCLDVMRSAAESIYGPLAGKLSSR